MSGKYLHSTVQWQILISLLTIVLKMSCTRSFGKKSQGTIFWCPLPTVAWLQCYVHSVKGWKMLVYHEFWFEEATHFANKFNIQMKLTGKFCRAQEDYLESQLTSENDYKQTLIVQTVKHNFQNRTSELLNAYLWYPWSWDIQHIGGTPCWHVHALHWASLLRIKWKHSRKDIELPFTILKPSICPDVKFSLMCMSCWRACVFL
jgi:hypothetical protein